MFMFIVTVHDSERSRYVTIIIIKLISILDIIAHNFHFYVTFAVLDGKLK